MVAIGSQMVSNKQASCSGSAFQLFYGGRPPLNHIYIYTNEVFAYTLFSQIKSPYNIRQQPELLRSASQKRKENNVVMSIRASRSIPMRSISIPNWNPVSAKHKYLPVRLLALDAIYCDKNSQWNHFLVYNPPSDQTTWRGVSGLQDGQGDTRDEGDICTHPEHVDRQILIMEKSS